MSRRFSNLQYLSIGILFGTCVFLWARKLNLMGNPIDRSASNLRQTPRNENEEKLIDSWVDKVEPEEQLSNLLQEEDDANNAIEELNPNDHLRPKDRVVLDSSRESLLLSNNTSQEVAMEQGPSDNSPGDLQSEIESTEPVEPVPDPLTLTEDTTDSQNDELSLTNSASKTVPSSGPTLPTN